MRNSRSDAGARILERSGLCVLSLLASIACGSNSGNGGAETAAGGAAAGGNGQVSSGGSAGTSSTNQGTAGVSTGKATTATSANTGGAGSGGTNSGGVSSTPTSSSKAGTSATGGVGSGGMSSGGTSATRTNTGGNITGGANAGGTNAGGSSATRTTANAAGGVGAGGTGGVSTGGKTTSSDATGGVGGVATSGTATGGTSVTDSVTRSTSTYAFKHYPIQTNSDGVWNGPSSPGTQVTTTTYNTVILENGYLKVTILPDYGGRVLSIIHKPTNTELLYQNPIGTPYLMGEGIFYYDYLVIMGGIFPSFPEPEHGRYWNQPYTLKVVSESKEAITIRMSRTDDKNVTTGVPSKYDVGRTDIMVDLDVTLRAGSASLELATKLTNTQNKAVPKFEYWTVNTLAPGSSPGKTAIPLNTRIQAVMDQVHLLVSSWDWFTSAETNVSGEIFKWNNLSYFKNWQDQGTAFANPSYAANWSGLTNYDNNLGIARVSDTVNTPGLKLWTFGPQGLTANINDSTQWVRPAIEMWHGVTPEFWNRGTMAANEVRQWTETYFPTLGMQEVTAASNYGVMYLSTSKSGTDTVLSVAATLTLPNQTVKAVLRLNGTDVSTQDVVVDPKNATKATTTVASNTAAAGTVFEAEFRQGDTSLLTGKITLK